MGSVTSNPNITIQLLPAAIVDAFADRRDLICGQIGESVVDAPTAVDGQLYQDVHAMTTIEIKELFGDASFLTNMILDWKSSNEGYSPLDVVSKDPVSGSGTCEIALTGTAATAAGTLYVSVVDEEKYKVAIPVAIGDTPTVVGTAITAALLALTDPVFVASGTTTVICTATDVGGIADNYGVKVDGAVAGITVAITAWTVVTPVNPTLTGILDVIDGIRYTGIVWPEAWVSDLDIPQDILETRFNAANQVMDGTCFMGMTALYADIITDVGLLNSQTVVIMGSPLVSTTDINEGPAVLRPADWVACEFVGIRSRRLTTGAPIADDIITTSGALDAYGGPSLASLPYFNTPLRDTPVTPTYNLFDSDDQAALEAIGYTTYGVNSAQNAMIMGPVVTNWTTDAGGNDNVSFHYLNYVDTGSVCREIFWRVLKSSFSQSRLTEGALIAGRSMANAESIKAELLRIYGILSNLALTQSGTTAERFFSDNTTVTVSLANRSATISGPLPIVTQLGTINYSLQMSFTIAGTETQITV